MPATKEELKAAMNVMQMSDLIVDCVKQYGNHGCSINRLFAAFICFDCSVNRFSMLVGALVSVGRIRKEGHLLFT